MLPHILDPINNTYQDYVSLSVRTAAPLENRENLLHAVLGIADELLEINGLLDEEKGEDFKTKLIKELGDVTWFTALYAQWSFDEAWYPDAQAVFDKLWADAKTTAFRPTSETLRFAIRIAGRCVSGVKREYAYKKNLDVSEARDFFVSALSVVYQMCEQFDITIEEVLTRNIAKLSARYKQGSFTKAEAVNRDESKE